MTRELFVTTYERDAWKERCESRGQTLKTVTRELYATQLPHAACGSRCTAVDAITADRDEAEARTDRLRAELRDRAEAHQSHVEQDPISLADFIDLQGERDAALTEVERLRGLNDVLRMRIDNALADEYEARQQLDCSREVSPERYGAKADGVTDDTGAIQAAADIAKLMNERDEAIAQAERLTTCVQMCCDGSSEDDPATLCARRVSELLARAEFAERELSLAFDLPPTIGPCEGEAARIVRELRERAEKAERLRTELAEQTKLSMTTEAALRTERILRANEMSRHRGEMARVRAENDVLRSDIVKCDGCPWETR
jgi:hypothetical protein